MIKKQITLLTALLLAVSLTACSQAEGAVSEAETVLSVTESQKEAETGTAQSPEESRQETEAETETGQAETSRVLIAYFSRMGNTDYPADVDATTSASIVTDETGQYGTTEYMARQIQAVTGGEMYLIETEESYPADFDAVVDRNHEEVNEGVLPALKDTSLDMADYDVIFVGYPVWATDTPQAIHSFLGSYDFNGKTVIPFCTHDGYGAGGSYSTVAALCPGAEVLDGLAVEAEDVPEAGAQVASWVESLGLSENQEMAGEVQSGETAVKITIGDTVLDGVLYDNAESRQFMELLPQTITMVGFGGREYYGGLEGEIQTEGQGQYHFEDGQITYCPANHTAAIFYAQTDRPDLTMEVFPMGIVTSDLSVFDSLPGTVDITFSLAE